VTPCSIERIASVAITAIPIAIARPATVCLMPVRMLKRISFPADAKPGRRGTLRRDDSPSQTVMDSHEHVGLLSSPHWVIPEAEHE
jgi:hypothetical protein